MTMMINLGKPRSLAVFFLFVPFFLGAKAQCGDVTNNIDIDGGIYNHGGDVSIGNVNCGTPPPDEEDTSTATLSPVSGPSPTLPTVAPTDVKTPTPTPTLSPISIQVSTPPTIAPAEGKTSITTLSPVLAPASTRPTVAPVAVETPATTLSPVSVQVSTPTQPPEMETSKTAPLTSGQDGSSGLLVAFFVVLSLLLVAFLVFLCWRMWPCGLSSNEKRPSQDESTETGEGNQVFVSHTGQDKHAADFAAFLSRFLKNQLRIAHFVDFEGIPPGVMWKAEIEENAQQCPVFVCILSASYLARYWCMHELDLAIQAGTYIIPVLCDYKLPTHIDFEAFKQLHRDDPDHDVSEEELDRWCDNLRLLPNIQAVRNYNKGKDTQAKFVEKVASAIQRGLGSSV